MKDVEFCKMEVKILEESDVIKKKTIPYWISFSLMLGLSLVECFSLLKSTLRYLQGSVGTKTLAVLMIIASTIFFMMFTLLLIVRFFKGNQSLSANVVQMLILGICGNLTGFFADYFSGRLIVSKTNFYLGLIISIIYVIHLFIIPEFKYITLNDSEEFDDTEEKLDDSIEGQEDNDDEIIEESQEKNVKKLDNKEVIEKKKKHHPKHFESKQQSEENDDEEYL